MSYFVPSLFLAKARTGTIHLEALTDVYEKVTNTKCNVSSWLL